MRERLCGVQAYSVRVTFYLVMHFCAWTSESPGQLSKNTCVGFIPRVQFGRSGVHLGIRIVLQLSRQFCCRARSGSHYIDQCFQSGGVCQTWSHPGPWPGAYRHQGWLGRTHWMYLLSVSLHPRTPTLACSWPPQSWGQWARGEFCIAR